MSVFVNNLGVPTSDLWGASTPRLPRPAGGYETRDVVPRNPDDLPEWATVARNLDSLDVVRIWRLYHETLDAANPHAPPDQVSFRVQGFVEESVLHVTGDWIGVEDRCAAATRRLVLTGGPMEQVFKIQTGGMRYVSELVESQLPGVTLDFELEDNRMTFRERVFCKANRNIQPIRDAQVDNLLGGAVRRVKARWCITDMGPELCRVAAGEVIPDETTQIKKGDFVDATLIADICLRGNSVVLQFQVERVVKLVARKDTGMKLQNIIGLNNQGTSARRPTLATHYSYTAPARRTNRALRSLRGSIADSTVAEKAAAVSEPMAVEKQVPVMVRRNSAEM